MIAKVIHQTWKTSEIPQRYQGFAESWRRHHPGWEYRLWTDEDLRAFVAREYPDFLAIYEGYGQHIKRVDAARYLILRTHGGLYVDLDFECFKSIEPLIAGCTLAIGLEPAEHVRNPKTVRRGLRRMLCPSLIASEPGHPYWDVVLAELRYYYEVTEVLDATGPFLLTRALDELADPDTVRLLSASDVYPIDSERSSDGTLFDLARWDDATRGATALHHWDGTWLQTEHWYVEPAHDRLPPALRDQLPEVLHPELADPPAAPDEPLPLVSAMMVTRDRPAKAMFAVECFRRQTYPNKELVIVDDGADDTLAREVARVDDPRLRMIRLPDRGETLGALRNIAVEESAGELVCQWDDDDLYHPLRLEVQMHHVRRTGAQVCLLTRWMMWWVATQRFALGEHRLWEGSMLCRKDVLPRYLRLAALEDVPVIHQLARTRCVVGLDQPRLYLYIVHGNNTWFPNHFEHFWRRAERRFEGPHADRVYRELARDLPLDAYAR